MNLNVSTRHKEAHARQKMSHCQARQEPQQGPGKHTRGASKHIHGAPQGENFWIFLSKQYILAYTLYFWPPAGPPNVAGPGVANPLPDPPDGPARCCLALSGLWGLFCGTLFGGTWQHRWKIQDWRSERHQCDKVSLLITTDNLQLISAIFTPSVSRKIL